MFGMTRRPIRDPMLDLLYNLERRMGRVFEPFGDFEWRMGETTGAWTPVVDIFEEANALRIVAEVPGVKPEDVKISVENNVLTIQGTKEQLAMSGPTARSSAASRCPRPWIPSTSKRPTAPAC
jgi:HSP20 family molecular chaperone IbpA